MKKFTLLVVALLGFASAHAQTGRTIFGQQLKHTNPQNGLVRCVSDEYEAALQAKFPERANKEAFESWIAPKVEEAKQRLLSSRNVAVVVTIPVVVHVIHNGSSVGSGANISDARVLSQITALNNDFRRVLGTRGYNTNSVGADIEVQFCMAQVKPDGSATNGIDRVNMGMANWATEDSVEGTLKPQTSWDPTQYFNIWVCQFSDNQADDLGGVLGYAQFPDNSGLGGLNTIGGAANTDGVICDWRCFGSADFAPAGGYFQTYDLGRTLTHEIGHCFGLRHIWGDNASCAVNTADSSQDFCPDTPAANQPHFDCLQVYNTCTIAPGNDMTENYMDYSNDACMNIFTLNQKARILAVLQNSPRRSSLTTSTKCTALATENFDKLQGLNLYPNPANNFVSISVSGDLPEAYEIFNTLGQIVAKKKIASDSDLTISTSNFANGVYLMKVTSGSATKTLRFIKQ